MTIHNTSPNSTWLACMAIGPSSQRWASDITYIRTDEGWLYLAAVLDLTTRRIVGWSMADHLRAQLCTDALQMALDRNRASHPQLHHSDRGVQYACHDYQQLLSQHQITCSMSRKGNCWDNAAMESFFATLKTELIHREHYATRQQARNATGFGPARK